MFTGTLATLDQAGADLSDNGVLATQGTDTVTFTYQDVLDGNGSSAAPTSTTSIDTPAVVTGVTGTVTQEATIAPGGDVTITVTDADLDTDPGLAETVVVTTVNETTGESESVTLTETGTDTGVFSAVLPTAEGAGPGVNDDGTMTAAVGERLTTTYQDALTDTGGTAAPTASTDVTAAVTVTGSIVATASVAPGSGVDVTVNDADLDTDPGLAETVLISVRNSRTGELESLTLTETGPATGGFTATLRTVDSATAGVDDDGSMNVQDGDTLVSTYEDAADAGGAPATVTASTSVTGAGGTINLQGRVFTDNGAGGGTAHDGLYNGTEQQLGGRRVELRAADNTLIAATDTLLDGSYAFTIDNSFAGSPLTLALTETFPHERHISSNPVLLPTWTGRTAASGSLRRPTPAMQC